MTAIINADCLHSLREMPDNSVDAIITDPPYGLSNTSPDKVTETIVRWASGDREHVPAGRGFMGAAWDGFVPPPAVWDECFRVLKPGGHMAVFAGTRTMDLMTLGVRLAGFDIRDSLAWIYGSGFPKSQNVSKMIDKAAGAKREVVGVGRRVHAAPVYDKRPSRPDGLYASPDYEITASATDEAKKWEGWGTATKPAYEPIILARKPLAEKTVAANVVKYGTGAINIDATRIGIGQAEREVVDKRSGSNTKAEGWGFQPTGETSKSHAQGRFPANVVLDPDTAKALDQQSGPVGSNSGTPTKSDGTRNSGGMYSPGAAGTSQSWEKRGGGASRFFKVVEPDPPFMYAAKAPKKERPTYVNDAGETVQHLTVKPVSICRWLVKLVTPEGGTVLDPFAGSGTTVEAAILEGFNVIGIEAHGPYIPLIEQRVARAEQGQAALNIA